MAKKTTKPTAVTSAADWRKPREEGVVVTLPSSGHNVRIRPIAMDVLLKHGKIPDILTPIAAKTVWIEEDPEEIANVAETAKGYAELINLIVLAAVVEPKVVEADPQDDEITLDDIEFGDKVAIFNLATAGASAMENFRKRQAAALVSVPNGNKNSHEAEPVSTD